MTTDCRRCERLASLLREMLTYQIRGTKEWGVWHLNWTARACEATGIDNDYSMHFPPGEYLREELAERGWGTDRLMEALGISGEQSLALLTGSTPVTRKIAGGLSKLFGQEAETWLHLQDSWDRRLKSETKGGP